MSTLTATPISASSVVTVYNRDTFSPADMNTFKSVFKTCTDAIIVDLASLNTDKLEDDDDITFTGTIIMNGTVTLGSTLTVTGASTLTGNITFAGNLVSSGSSKTINFNTNRVQNIGSATASTDAIQYQQAVKATGSVNENVTGIKTFTTGLPICSTVPSSGSDLTNKTYVDLQVFGNSGITQSASSPATTLGALWLDTTNTSNYELFRANGSVFAPVSGIFQGSSAPTTPTPATGRLWLDTTTANQTSLKYYTGSAWKQCLPATIDAATTFTSAVTMTASTVFNGGFSVAASQTINMGANKITNVATPVATTDAPNKAYVDALSPRKFSQTATTTTTSTSETTLTNTGSGSLTLGANTLAVGNVIRITAAGNYTDGTGTLTLKVKAGIITFATITLPDVNVTGSTEGKWRLDALITVRSGNFASGQAVATISDMNTTPTNQYYIASDGGISNVFDITTSNAIDVTAQWAATAGTLTCTDLVVEVI